MSDQPVNASDLTDAGGQFSARELPFSALDLAEARALRARAARRDITERRRVTARLREALAEDGLVLHYQPQVHLKTGIVRGAEALIRLHHRRRGMILPTHFMPIAERSDIINDIGGWTLGAACQEAALWPSHLTVAMEVTGRQLRSGRITKMIIEALAKWGLPAEQLEVELTEAMLIDDNDESMFTLKALRGMGIRLALNNFGTGYASLSALKRLPLSTLRLDRSLVEYLGHDLSGSAIVHAAVEAGHALGCSVLAEGVDSAEQCRLLEEIGCDEGQGQFFSPPITAPEFRAKLHIQESK